MTRQGHHGLWEWEESHTWHPVLGYVDPPVKKTINRVRDRRKRGRVEYGKEQ